MASNTNAGSHPANDPSSRIEIQIDRAHYEVHQAQLTGAELRALPSPPIGAERDLYLVVPGGTDDKIDNSEAVEMKNGLRLYTTPALINPGRR